MISTRTFRPSPVGGRSISRRGFLAGLGAAAAAGALLAIDRRLLPAATQPAPAGLELRRSLFAAELGGLFQVFAGTAHQSLQLIDVRDLHAPIYRQAAIDREQNFSLLFRSPGSSPLEQGTYQFLHGRIGSFPLFVVPVQAHQQASYYEAIFSRHTA
jgi:hypothetical protein